MLDLIRKKQKTVIIKVVFWAIIATFVGTIFLVWGKGKDGGEEDASVAVTINKTKIGFEEYQTAYSNLYRFYQNIYREQLTPDLEKQLRIRQQALDALIEHALLLQEGKRLGIKVSQEELVKSIAQIPVFQENGVFSKERYLQVLAYQRMTPDGFEAIQKRQLLTEKVRERIQEGITVTDEDIEQEYRSQNEKVNIAFLRLAPALFENRVSVKEEALQSYFAEHREDFRIPETIALRYLQFEPARYEKEITFEQEELEKYYRRHLDSYEIPEQVKAAHILIKVTAKADPAIRQKKRALAEKILGEARSGKNFAKLARTYSDDAASIAQGGDLGYFNRETMAAAFEKAAFDLNPGEISDIVETPFGYHIIKCEGRIEAGLKPLADVLDNVKENLRVQKARHLALEKAMDAYNINRKSGDLEKAAKENDLGIKETGFFSQRETIDGLGDAPEISAAAFALKPGELAKPVNLPQGIFLFTVKDRRESRLPELAEVRKEVEHAYRKEKGRELARQTAEKILADLGKGEKLVPLARKHNLKVEETGFFSRSYNAFIPRLGNSEVLARTAFDLTKEAPAARQVFDIDGKYVVATLKDRQKADPKGLNQAEREELRKILLTRKKDEALNNKLRELRTPAEIVIAPTLLASFEKE
jgi:peptidyl-prolyl cis-trans isomerase D